MRFSPKDLKPFKIQKIKLELIIEFIIQNPEGLGSWANEEICSILNYLPTCQVWKFLDIGKIMFCIFQLGHQNVFEKLGNHLNKLTKPAHGFSTARPRCPHQTVLPHCLETERHPRSHRPHVPPWSPLYSRVVASSRSKGHLLPPRPHLRSALPPFAHQPLPISTPPKAPLKLSSSSACVTAKQERPHRRPPQDVIKAPKSPLPPQGASHHRQATPAILRPRLHLRELRTCFVDLTDHLTSFLDPFFSPSLSFPSDRAESPWVANLR
jgi:hypothetical protein